MPMTRGLWLDRVHVEVALEMSEIEHGHFEVVHRVECVVLCGSLSRKTNESNANAVICGHMRS